MKRQYKVLVAKPGLDGHDRGAHIVARGLRDAGFEVVLTGLFQTVDMIVAAAVDEDVDAVGLSILSGAHNLLLPRIAKALEREIPGTLIVAGGMIPRRDIPALIDSGVSKVFGPGSTLAEISKWLESELDSLEPS
jgi:methylmalonyl-CoA mutase C-terminal domain/subunit